MIKSLQIDVVDVIKELTVVNLTSTSSMSVPAFQLTTGAGVGRLLQSDTNGNASWQTIPADVQGPQTSTDRAVARFDGESGNVLKNSATIVDDTGTLSTQAVSVSAFKLATGAAADRFLRSDATGNASWTEINPGSGDVIGPGSSTANALAVFSGTSGKVLKDSNAILDDGGLMTVASLSVSGFQLTTGAGVGRVLQSDSTGNSSWATLSADVAGPASSTDDAIARFNGTTGKLVQNSLATLSDVGTLSAPFVSTGGFQITTDAGVGRVLQSDASGNGSWVALSADVAGPANSTADAVAVFNGTTGKVLKNSVTTLSGAGLLTTGAVSVDALTLTTGAGAGRLLQSDGDGNSSWVVISADVAGPGSATDDAIARFNGITGKLVQNSLATVNDVGLMTTPSLSVGALQLTTGASAGRFLQSEGSGNSSWVELNAGTGDVVGPGLATDTAIAVYNGTSGKVIKNSGATIDGAGTFTTALVAVPAFRLTTGASAGRFLQSDGSGNSSWVELNAGTGDVVGPGLATDTAVAVYNGTSGKVIKNSGATIDASGTFTTALVAVPAFRLTTTPGAGRVLQSDGSGNGSWVATGSASGVGNVSNDGSSTDNAVVRWDGTTGRIVQNSTTTLSDAGLLTVSAFQLTASPTSNYVLTSDGSGNASWSAPSVRNFSTRANFVTNVATLTGLSDGSVVSAAGLLYYKSTGATAISDLPGWLPFRDVWVEHFGATTVASRSQANASSANNAPNIQAAIDYIATTFNGGIIRFSQKYYRITTSIVVATDHIHLKGVGASQTVLFATNFEGPVVYIQDEYSVIEEIQLDANDARRDSVTPTKMYGLLYRTLDPDDTSLRMRTSIAKHLKITNQPNAALYISTTAYTGLVTNCWFISNKSHAVLIDKDYEFSGVPKTDVSGLCTFEECQVTDNGGNGFAFGNKNDTASTTQATRIVVRNCEISNNSTDATKRFDPAQIFCWGCADAVFFANVLKDGNSTNSLSGFYLTGRNLHCLANRYIGLTVLVVIDSRTALPTNGIYIEGINNLSGGASLAEAIRVQNTSGSSTAEPEAIFVTLFKLQGGLTTTIKTGANMDSGGGAWRVPGLGILGQHLVLVKTTSQTSTDTNFVEDDAIKFWLVPNELVNFTLTMQYSCADNAADIKIRWALPSGATTVFGPPSCVGIGTSDNIVIMNASSGTFTFGTSSTARLITLVGHILNGSTAGKAAIEWARNTGSGSALTVSQKTTFIRIERQVV